MKDLTPLYHFAHGQALKKKHQVSYLSMNISFYIQAQNTISSCLFLYISVSVGFENLEVLGETIREP